MIFGEQFLNQDGWPAFLSGKSALLAVGQTPPNVQDMFGQSDEDEPSEQGAATGVLGEILDQRAEEVGEVPYTKETTAPGVNSDSVYSEDPQFQTKELLDTFMLNYKPVIECEETNQAVRECTCQRCEGISHAGGDHLCCRQITEKWIAHLNDEEKLVTNLCLTETLAYNAVVNEHSLRVLILCKWDKSNIVTTDPPQNSKFRHNAYYAVSMMIEGKKKARKRKVIGILHS